MVINAIVSDMFVIETVIKKWTISFYVYNHWWHLCQWNSLCYFFTLLTYLSVRLSWVKVNWTALEIVHQCKYYSVLKIYMTLWSLKVNKFAQHYRNTNDNWIVISLFFFLKKIFLYFTMLVLECQQIEVAYIIQLLL
jgi:hypothetical protein